MAIIDDLFEQGVLVSPDVLENPQLIKRLELIDPKEFEKVDMIDLDFFTQLDKKSEKNHYEVVFSYDKKPGKISLNDFVAYFNRRFEGVSAFLRQRQEFMSTTSISKLKSKKEKDKVSVIGMVFEKSETKKGTLILTLEDPTGTINVLIRPDKKELHEIAKDIVHDEIIGVEGNLVGDAVFANQIFFPDVPSTKELKKSPEEEYVAFVGDAHVGSKLFLKESFEDFIDWISGNKGSDEQRALAAKVKYVIFAGDLVEGVGVYPGQESDLVIKDITDQYDKFAEYASKIPQDKTLFFSPGNHDAGRLSEPQQPLLHKYASALQKLPNAVFVSNPAIVKLGIKKNFPGFDVLIYHGYSLIYFSENVPSIRSKGGQKRPDLIMKFLLQRRHLAPTHTSNLYIPDRDEDPLIIKEVPDIFVTGHIHRLSVGTYKNVNLINCSCWAEMSDYQEKLGLEAQPAKLPLLNLKTRELKIINFLKEDKKQQEKTEEAIVAVAQKEKEKEKEAV